MISNSCLEIIGTKSTKNRAGARLSTYKFDISPSNLEFVEEAYSYVRRKLGRAETDEMEEINIKRHDLGIKYVRQRRRRYVLEYF